jgi:hypothetical protein
MKMKRRRKLNKVSNYQFRSFCYLIQWHVSLPPPAASLLEKLSLVPTLTQRVRHTLLHQPTSDKKLL